MERAKLRKFNHQFVELTWRPKGGKNKNTTMGTIRGVHRKFIVFHINDDDNEIPILYEYIDEVEIHKRAKDD